MEDVGTAACVRTSGVVAPAAASPAVGATLGSPLAVAVAVLAAVAVARLVSDGPLLVVRTLPPVAGPREDVVELRRVVVLADGFGLGLGFAAAGGRVLGGVPAPKAQPSTLPALGLYEPAPVVLYTHEPPGEACQYDQ